MLNCPNDDKIVRQLCLHAESDRDVLGYFINMAPNIAEQNQLGFLQSILVKLTHSVLILNHRYWLSVFFH